MIRNTNTEKMPPCVLAAPRRFCVFLFALFSPLLGVADGRTAKNFPSQIPQLKFTHLFENNLAVGPVEKIVQDHEGYMWFGGTLGPARYDGSKLRIFRHDKNDETSLSDDSVLDMLVDRKGRLWVATVNGLNVFKPSTQTFKRYFGAKAGGGDSRSHNYVRSLTEARSGNIWVGAGAGMIYLYDDIHSTFVKYAHAGTFGEGAIRSLQEDASGNLWFGTYADGLGKFDTRKRKAEFYRHQKGDANSLMHNDVGQVLVDSTGDIWVGTESGGGISVLDPETDIFRRYPYDPSNPNGVGSRFIREIFEDSKKNIWIGSDSGGLQRYDAKIDGFVSYKHDRHDNRSINNNTVSAIYEDANHDFWIAVYYNSIDFIDFSASVFNNYAHIPKEDKGLRYRAILSFAQDEGEYLWVGTEAGLNRVNVSNNKFTHYFHDPNNEYSKTNLPGHSVTSLLLDSKKRLWVGTWSGGVSRFQAETKTFKHYRYVSAKKPGAKSTLSHLAGSKVWALYEDASGAIWVGTQNKGLSRYDPETDSFTKFGLDNVPIFDSEDLEIWAISEDSNKNLLLGVHEGFIVLDPKRKKIKHYRYDNKIKKSDSTITPGRVRTFYEDALGILWIGSVGGGLNRFDPKGEEFTNYQVGQGLPDNVVSSIQADANGFLWIATENGLARFDKKKGEFSNFYKRHGLPCSSFTRNASLVNFNGELIFGCVDGYSVFNPQDIKENTFVPPVVITDFKVADTSVMLRNTIRDTSADGRNFQLGDQDKNIQFSVTLTHDQAVFSFEYSALNFRIYEDNQYAYILDGFDSQWNEVGKKRKATYTNLNPGEYLFRVKGSNNIGVWNHNDVRAKVIILPPWWKTWWARTLFASLLFLAFAFLVKSFQRKLSEEREKSRDLEELSQLKDKFLANTSHELKSPLNGIVGLAESLVAGRAGRLSELTLKNLSMIILSGFRLSALLDEILDFARLKNKKVVLNVQSVSLYELSNMVLSRYSRAVDKDNLNLVCHIPESFQPVFADPKRLEQVLSKLVDNAIKFTAHGRVEISAERKEEFAIVKVADTGEGIPPEKLESIFDSFSQAENSDSRVHGGTGLGLTIARDIIELHGGTMDVESEKHNGSIFSFTLPIDNQAKSVGESPKSEHGEMAGRLAVQAKTVTNIEILQQVHKEGMALSCNVKNHVSDKDLNARILIVDDEPVNRLVIQNYLTLDGHDVSVAESGMEALAIIEDKSRFDLIVLDIMMPNMSGFEVCSTIRERYSIAELPIIFLTAKNQVSDLAEGYRLGANDFLTKPVCKEELSARVYSRLGFAHTYLELFAQAKSNGAELSDLSTCDHLRGGDDG